MIKIDECEGKRGYNRTRFEATNVITWEGFIHFTQSFVNRLKNNSKVEWISVRVIANRGEDLYPDMIWFNDEEYSEEESEKIGKYSMTELEKRLLYSKLKDTYNEESHANIELDFGMKNRNDTRVSMYLCGPNSKCKNCYGGIIYKTGHDELKNMVIDALQKAEQ